MKNRCARLSRFSDHLSVSFAACTLAVLCIIGSSATRSSAQTVDTAILGTVTDPSGAAIPGAQVTVTSPATGVSQTVTTGANGAYRLGYLLPGTYTVSAQAQGFSRAVRQNITLELSQEAEVDIPLTIGQTTQSVQVTAAAPLLNTTSGALSGVVNPQETVSLPLNGRNFGQLAVLTPGIQASASSQNTSFSANGVDSEHEQVTLDGGTIVDNRANAVFLLPSIDAIQEFRVNTSDYAAEYGDNSGAVVSVQLKSGTNDFHGVAYDFLRNDVLDARGYFLSPTASKNPLRRNQFGGVLGGPIRKNSTFFLVGYEGNRQFAATPSVSETFTPRELSGDFSFVSSPLINPRTGQKILNNNISALLDPNAVRIAKTYMPAANCNGELSGVNNYCGESISQVDSNQGLVRVDQTVGNNGHFFADYVGNFGHFPSISVNPFFPVRYDFTAQTFTSQYVHTFSPAVVDEVLFAVDFGTLNQLSPRAATGFSISKTLGINGFDTEGPGGPPIAQQFQGFPQLSISSFLAMGDNDGGQAEDQSKTYQFVDNVSISHGKHFIKFGGELRRVDDNADTSNSSWGNETFNGDLTETNSKCGAGCAAADFLLGLPDTTLSPEGIPVNAIRQWRSALYVQDDWKVNSRLTLNLGVRWDWTQLPQDTAGVSRTLRFDLPGGPVLWPAPGDVQPMYIHPQPPIEPRFGFAFKIDSKDVLRGGFGLFDSEAKFDNINILQLNPPLHASIESINPIPVSGQPPQPLVVTLENPIDPAEVAAGIYDVVSEPPNRRKVDPYQTDWNATFQRQVTNSSVFEIGYSATRGTDLDTSDLAWNSPQPASGPIQPRRPYPTWGEIRMVETNGWSLYNSLQASFRHQMSHGFTLTSQYTWAHLINNIQGSTNGSRALEQNPLLEGTNAERGNASSDVPQDFTAGYVWDLPFGNSLHGFEGQLVKGWETSGLITFVHGSPLLIVDNGDLQNTDNSGAERPNYVQGQSIFVSNPSPAGWFNAAAFVPSVLSYGNVPRNPGGLYGPGVKTFDLSLSRSFKMPFLESQSLLFRAEFFNAFNTPQFGRPGTTVGTSSFGKITSTGGSDANRVIQLALKYNF
jgi:hypothetical protein